MAGSEALDIWNLHDYIDGLIVGLIVWVVQIAYYFKGHS